MSHTDSEGSFNASLIATGNAPLPANVKPAPIAPIQYEKAVQALEACATLDEAKLFDNKVDALAAWAKIYCDDRAAIASRRLKLHAYRRIGTLAEQMRPTPPGRPGGNFRKGAQSLLVEKGFTQGNAIAALRVARVPAQEFAEAVRSERPPSPSMFVQVRTRKNPDYARLSIRVSGLLSLLRKQDFAKLAASMDEKDTTSAMERNAETVRLIEQFQGLLRTRLASISTPVKRRA